MGPESNARTMPFTDQAPDFRKGLTSIVVH
jgi:hypothetical protein